MFDIIRDILDPNRREKALVAANEERRLQGERIAQQQEAAHLRHRQQENARKAIVAGREIAKLLMSRRIASAPIYENIGGSTGVVETCKGWTVAEISTYEGDGMMAGSIKFGLTEEGASFEYFRTRYEETSRGPRNGVFEGILFPKFFEGEKAYRMITNETFKTGVASLVAAGVPYRDRNVYDY